MIDTTEIRAALDKATPGPWLAVGREIVHPEGPQYWNGQEVENVALIAVAVSALPALCDQIEAQAAEIAKLRDVAGQMAEAVVRVRENNRMGRRGKQCSDDWRTLQAALAAYEAAK